MSAQRPATDPRKKAPAEPSVADLRPWRDPTAVPFVRIKNVSKKFGDTKAVNDITLDIYQGELFCILGGSGSGKSTLLRMLAGFENISAGQIEIDGQDMADVAPFERPINMMFQSYALFPHMNAATNIAYGLKRMGLGRAEIDNRVRELLHLVKLEGYERRKPHQLSGGQKQRVALARSLARQPKLLLLDEPLGALDKKLREETQFELVKIQEALGVTFIVVTHDQEEAMSLATRIGVMDEGNLVQIGEPREIYEYPNSRYVADFVGSVNLFEAQIVDMQPDHVRLKLAEISSEIMVAPGITGSIGQTVWFALRPEKMRLSRSEPDTSDNFAKGVVEEVIYLGDSSVYRIILEGGRQIKTTQPNIHRPDARSISWDEHVFVSWANDAGSVLTS